MTPTYFGVKLYVEVGTIRDHKTDMIDNSRKEFHRYPDKNGNAVGGLIHICTWQA